MWIARSGNDHTRSRWQNTKSADLVQRVITEALLDRPTPFDNEEDIGNLVICPKGLRKAHEVKATVDTSAHRILETSYILLASGVADNG